LFLQTSLEAAIRIQILFWGDHRDEIEIDMYVIEVERKHIDQWKCVNPMKLNTYGNHSKLKLYWTADLNFCL